MFKEQLKLIGLLRPMNNYPFHLGVTEAGTQFHSTIKSSIASREFAS